MIQQKCKEKDEQRKANLRKQRKNEGVKMAKAETGVNGENSI